MSREQQYGHNSHIVSTYYALIKLIVVQEKSVLDIIKI